MTAQATIRNSPAPLLLAALLALAACGSQDHERPAQREGPATAIPLTDETVPPQPMNEAAPLPPGSVPERPASIRDTIEIEGMPESTTARLFRAPDGWGLPFSTYIPAGIEVAPETDADSGGIRFAAAFTGRADPNAYMHVYVYPRGATGIVARQGALEFLRSRFLVGDEARPAPAPPWAHEAYAMSYSGDGGVPYTGSVVVASHRGRYFHVVRHYPAEYGDGLEPRFRRILERWRWEDTGRSLLDR
jgi:hypothetical protein